MPLPALFLHLTASLHSLLLSVLLRLLRELLRLLGWASPTRLTDAQKRDLPLAEALLPALYTSQTPAALFRHYAATAVFDDPLLRAEGPAQIRAAFRALDCLSRSRAALVCEPLVSDRCDDRVLALLLVRYVPRVLPLSLNLVSVVSLRFASDGSVLSHEDRWLGVPLIAGPAFGPLGNAFELWRSAVGFVVYSVVLALCSTAEPAACHMEVDGHG